ncbi:hypothetical protein ACFE04_020626 [Oxalis oulophora]
MIVEVGVTAGGRLKFCGYGWMDFMEHHSIGHRFSLLFRYAGGCKFLVKIFNSNGGEIIYPSAPVKTTVVQNNGIYSALLRLDQRSSKVVCLDMAFPASFLKDNKLLLNKKYKRCIVEIPVGASVRSGLTWNYIKNVWRCSLMGGWKNFCKQCQPKKGDVVSFFLDFNEEDNMPVLRISFDDREFDFITQVKFEVLI